MDVEPESSFINYVTGNTNLRAALHEEIVNEEDRESDDRISLPNHIQNHRDEEYDSESNDQEEEEETGFLGFFKKTFSTVKKTFEETFTQKHADHSYSRHHRFRASTRPRSKVAGTPLLERELNFTRRFNNLDLLEESPRIQNFKSRVKFQVEQKHEAVVNRTTRSQTFHVS